MKKRKDIRQWIGIICLVLALLLPAKITSYAGDYSVANGNSYTFTEGTTYSYRGSGPAAITVRIDRSYTAPGWSSAMIIQNYTGSLLTVNVVYSGNYTVSGYNHGGIKINADGSATGPVKLIFNTTSTSPATLTVKASYPGTPGLQVVRGSLTTDISPEVMRTAGTLNTTSQTVSITLVKGVNIQLDQQGGLGGSTSVKGYYGLNPAKVAVPSKTGYTFGGYYTSPDGQGTQYYNEGGIAVRTSGFTSSSTLYAKWSVNTYELTLNNDGAVNTSALLTYGQPIPATVPVPVRAGYDFGGYYTDINGGGEAYYDAAGTCIRQETWTETSGLLLYAKWNLSRNTLTVNPNGGTWMLSGETREFTQNGKTKMNIPDPVRDGYTFLGWAMEGTGGSLDGRTYTFDAGTPVSLTAKWGSGVKTSFENRSAVTQVSGGDGLADAYRALVADGDKGITEADMAYQVDLTLTVSDGSDQSEGAADIRVAAQGSVAHFFDIVAEKTVTAQQGAPQTTRLSELPKPVQVRISLAGSLAGKTDYSVYRYHGGEVQRINLSPRDGESYTISAGTGSGGSDELVLYTRKFSTYAVVSGDKVLGSTGSLEHDGSGMDVQGKVVEGGDGAVYKIDLSWGPMVFEYSTGSSWNPDTHQYDGPRINAWLPDSFFQNGNNEFTAANHSNGDLLVSFDVSENDLTGVDMKVNATNSPDGAQAQELTLEKVPVEGAGAPVLNAYLWLTGTPTDLEALRKDTFTKAAVVTVTFKPAGGPRTPKR